MKFCEKCGKEIMDEAVVCPGCGCATKKTAVSTMPKPQSYEDAIKNSGTMLIIGGVLFVVGAVIGWLFNWIIGAVMLFVSEVLLMAPATALRKAVKKNNPAMKNKELSAEVKNVTKELGDKAKAMKIARVLAIVACVNSCVIILLCM